ncbi:MAG: hypothetical protein AB7P33_14230 [Dehalococcoidia bacterium]
MNSGLFSQPARMAGFLGIGFIVLFVASAIGQGETPMSTDSADEIRSFFVDNRDQYLIADFITGIALVFFFLPFAACLRHVLAGAEGEPGVCSRLFFSGAILTLAIGAAGAAGLGTLAMAAGDESINDSSLKLMMYASEYGFSGIGFGFALVAVSASIVMITTGVVAKWVGYVGVATAAINLVGATWIIDGDPEGVLCLISLIGFLAFGIWVLCTSVMLLRQPQTSAATMAPAAA